MNVNSLKFTGLPVLVALLAIGCMSANHLSQQLTLISISLRKT